MIGHNRDVRSSTENRDVERCIYAQYSKEESALDVNMENPNLGKTTAALRLQNLTIAGLQQWGTKATTSCSLASPLGGYNRDNNLFLSISLSLHSYSLHLIIKFALGHIYTNMTFGLYTNIAQVGLSGTYLHICPFHPRRLCTNALKASPTNRNKY